jgi:16S rRNA processing protein RimM
MQMDGAVAAGKAGGLFGKDGGLTLVLYDTFPRDVDMEEPLLVEIDGHVVPLFLESFARRGVRGATVVFADIDTPRRAEELVGREFFLRGAGEGRGRTGAVGVAGLRGDDGDGSADDELYFEDLVGWRVETGGREGRVTAFFESELNPLLEIELDGERELIPAQPDFVTDLDEARRTITLALPEGLLGLNG